MDLPTAEVDVDQAKEAAEAYREAAKRSRDAEDKMLATAYEAAAEGAQLLNIAEALRGGGTRVLEITRYRDTEHVHVPNLAIAPANLDFVWTMGINKQGGCRLQHRRAVSYRNQREVHELAAGTFGPGQDTIRGWADGHLDQCSRIAAMVPIVPPPLRPDDSLAKYHLLWEADWRDVGELPPPPGDPALLRHLGGDMYAVLAVWDLTPIERAVLAGRTVEEA